VSVPGVGTGVRTTADPGERDRRSVELAAGSARNLNTHQLFGRRIQNPEQLLVLRSKTYRVIGQPDDRVDRDSRERSHDSASGLVDLLDLVRAPDEETRAGDAEAGDGRRAP